MAEKGGLGSGLDLLFEDNETHVSGRQTLRTSDLEPNRLQPRRTFDEEAITSLADSIREHGILQPIVVRPLADGAYQIVAGERRWRAARMLGLSEVPVIIRELDDLETMQLALIENLQRENLNPVEEAQGYRELMTQHGMTQEEVAKTVGKSRSAIANTVRILALPPQVLELVETGALSAGHAKALISFSDETRMEQYAKRAAEGKLTVRQLERLAAQEEAVPDAKPKKPVDSYFQEMELSLTERMGRRVRVDAGKKSGVLILEFYDKEDLSALAKKLTE